MLHSFERYDQKSHRYASNEWLVGTRNKYEPQYDSRVFKLPFRSTIIRLLVERNVYCKNDEYRNIEAYCRENMVLSTNTQYIVTIHTLSMIRTKITNPVSGTVILIDFHVRVSNVLHPCPLKLSYFTTWKIALRRAGSNWCKNVSSPRTQLKDGTLEPKSVRLQLEEVV